MRNIVLLISLLVVSLSSFLGGMYVGLEQGLIYSLGLEARQASLRIPKYERGELGESEFRSEAELTLDSNISYFGEHLERDWFVHKVPSPWSMGESGISFMEDAINYRLENPRKYEEKMASLLKLENDENYIRLMEENMGCGTGTPPACDEQSMEMIKESLRFKKEREIYYQKALDYVRDSR